MSDEQSTMPKPDFGPTATAMLENRDSRREGIRGEDVIEFVHMDDAMLAVRGGSDE